MKKLLFSAVSALAVAGIVQAADSTEFGVMNVPSSATQTIVAVPWLESGTGSTDVSVANLVLTSGLHENDELRLYESGAWTKSWKLDASGKWVGAQVTTEKGTTQSGDDTTTIARGKAIMLIRSNPGTGFYIMGKPTTVAAKATDLSSGYTLIAPPTTSGDTDVNTGLTWTGLKKGDVLHVPNNSGMDIYRYYTSGWKNTSTGLTGSIPMGKGAWFYTTDTATKTVQLK